MASSQNILNEYILEGQKPCRVYLLDNSSKTVLFNDDTSFGDLVIILLNKLGLKNIENICDYFAIYTSNDGMKIAEVNANNTKVSEALLNFTEKSRFVFMIRLFMPSITGLESRDVLAERIGKEKELIPDRFYYESAEIEDEELFNLQFIQAVYNVITGAYVTSLEVALDLAAYYFYQKFGNNFDPKILQSQLLGDRILEYLSIRHFEFFDDNFENIESTKRKINKKNFLEEMESMFLTRLKGLVAASTKIDEEEAKRLYMNKIWSIDNAHGYTFFRGLIRNDDTLPEKAIIGIAQRGIEIFDRTRNLIKFYRIDFVLRWGYHPNKCFFFDVQEIHETDSRHISIDLKNGKEIADLLADYAMAYLKEGGEFDDDNDDDNQEDDDFVENDNEAADIDLFNKKKEDISTVQKSNFVGVENLLDKNINGKDDEEEEDYSPEGKNFIKNGSELFNSMQFSSPPNLLFQKRASRVSSQNSRSSITNTRIASESSSSQKEILEVEDEVIEQETPFSKNDNNNNVNKNPVGNVLERNFNDKEYTQEHVNAIIKIQSNVRGGFARERVTEIIHEKIMNGEIVIEED